MRIFKYLVLGFLALASGCNGDPVFAQIPGGGLSVVGPVTPGDCFSLLNSFSGQDSGAPCGGTGGSWEITDGTNTVTGIQRLTVTGGTVGGTTPDATLSISGGGGGVSLTSSAGSLTLTPSPITGTGTLDINYGHAATWNALQAYNNGDFGLNGSTSGTTLLEPAATASGTLSLPATTDTLVARATTDTLTNKTISGSSNTLSAIALSSLASETANTVVGALTATTPSALAVPSCSTASSALIWTSGTGFGCNTLSGSGTVNTGTANDLAYYATSTTAVSPLTTGNNGVLVTSGSGVPSISTTLPSGLAIPGSTLSGATGLSGTNSVTGGTLPTQVAGTLGIAGTAAAPTLVSGGGDIFLTAAGGLNLVGDGSANGLTLDAASGTSMTFNIGSTAVCSITASDKLSCMNFIVAGSGTTTGLFSGGTNIAEIEAGGTAVANFSSTVLALQTGIGLTTAGKILISPTAPSTPSGCGSTATISASNGTAAFEVTMSGTGQTSACTVTMPTATNAWVCPSADDLTTQSTSVFLQKQSASSNTSITITNYSNLSVATAFVAGDVLAVQCTGL